MKPADDTAALRELASSIEGLVQLANWQLALARDIRTRVAALADVQPRAGQPRRKRTSSGRTKKTK